MPTEYSPRIVTDGLVLCLDAANKKSYSGSGTNWYDLSGTKNNGVLFNGAIFNNINNGSIIFDGVGDYVQSINNVNITDASSRTISVWVYPTNQLSNIFYSVCKIGIGSDRRLYEILLYNNQVYGHFWGNGQSFGVNSDKILLNNYTNIHMSYDGGIAYIYIDGVLKGQMNISLITSNSRMILGLKTFGQHADYRGNIFNTYLYNRCLTATEIQRNYNALKGRFGL